MSGSMFYVPRRSQLPSFLPDVISSLFPSVSSDESRSETKASRSPPGSDADPACSKSSQRKRSSPELSPSLNGLPPALCFPQVSSTPEKRLCRNQDNLTTKTLQNLLRATHSIVAVVQPKDEPDGPEQSCVPNLVEQLCSAFLLGASTSHLRAVFDNSIEKLVPWTDSPCEISTDDWRNHLGDVEYQRAYLDFFEDQLVEYGYDWRSVVLDYMFRSDSPLIAGALSSWGAALVRLGLAYELDSSILAMQALTIAACLYTKHEHTLKPNDGSNVQFSSPSIQKVFATVWADHRVAEARANGNFAPLMVEDGYKHIVADYQNGWDISRQGSKDDVEVRFEQGRKALASAFVFSIDKDEPMSYSRPIANVLVLSHAIRIVIPEIPTTKQGLILYAWWRLALLAYIVSGCPDVVPNLEASDEQLSAELSRLPNDWAKVREAFVCSGQNEDDKEGDASELVAKVVQSSAEGGGRILVNGEELPAKTNGVDYFMLMKQVVEARRKRADAEDQEGQGEEGASTGVSYQQAGEGQEPEEEKGKGQRLWEDGTLATTASALRAAACEATAMNDRSGAQLFEVLANRTVDGLLGN